MQNLIPYYSLTIIKFSPILRETQIFIPLTKNGKPKNYNSKSKSYENLKRKKGFQETQRPKRREYIYIYQEERLTRIIFYTKKDVSFRRNTHHGFRGREKKQSQICAPVITNKLE
ncbi:hypothetical protein AAZV13_13G118450 [Glycine max]